MANKIRERLPEIEMYVPAESEEFVGRAYRAGYISEKQILEIDCQIIDSCDMVIVWIPEGDSLQGGRLVEYRHAVEVGIPVLIFSELEEAITLLSMDYLGILEKAGD